MSMNGSKKKTKIGPNDPCPCGSGKKFKKCHRDVSMQPYLEFPVPNPNALKIKLEQIQALQKQRQQQQGFGKSIISTVFQGYRIVAVGGKIFYARNWKTFHDFLFYYIKVLLGPDWGTAELKKPREERHPILNWHYDAAVYMNAFIKERGNVHNAPTVGVAEAYLCFAYDLYSLEHNAKVQRILLERLKKRETFLGAYYETYMAAALVRAGFEIEFEDETDSKKTHCELTATFLKTGKKFSVEAKMRQPDKLSFDVGNQLYAALKKDANHPRLIFIEINVPDDAGDQRTIELLGGALKSIRSREEKLTIDGRPAPPAYVIVTNNPYHYSQNAPCKHCAMAEGFKIPDFKFGDKYSDIRAALILREKHQEITNLMNSMAMHSFPPPTFDGEIPEFAFSADKSQGRLIIGEKYLLPDGKGGETAGELQHAAVLEKEKMAYCVYKMADGTQAIFSCPLTNEEIAAYQKFPDTFFGVNKPHTRGQITDPLELYDWFFDCYKQTPKERLLELMKNYPNYQHLQTLSQKDLASLYCETLVCGTLHRTGVSKNQRSALVSEVVREAEKPSTVSSIIKIETKTDVQTGAGND
jgi:SEC-C motif